MPGPYSIDAQSTPDVSHASAEPARRDESMDEEEKILANRTDANIPALLTRDVLGG